MSVPEVPTVTETDYFVERKFAAPRDVVWTYWSEPAALAEWFGPDAVHIDPESVVIEPRVGGRWDLDMVDNATSARYPLKVVLQAWEAPEYLQGFVEAGSEDGEISGVTLHMWLHDEGDSTRMVVHQGPFSVEHRDMTGVGWEESFVKLDGVLAAR